MPGPAGLHEPVASVMRRDMVVLDEGMTIGGALSFIREQGVGERVVYFYVRDAEGRLVGVLPVRRLLMAPPEEVVGTIMVGGVVSLPDKATLLDAFEAFERHRLLALPVVDSRGGIVGVIDATLVTDRSDEMVRESEREAVFEAIGVRLSEVRGGSPFRALRARFPWIGATLASGVVCAVLAGCFEATLQRAVVVALFLPMILALGESVAMQSVTLTLQSLHVARPTLRWFRAAMSREGHAIAGLSLACAAVVALVVLVWRGAGAAVAVIAAGAAGAVAMACVVGVTVPAVLHRLRLDLRLAAGPIALAVADVFTVVWYLGLAARWL